MVKLPGVVFYSKVLDMEYPMIDKAFPSADASTEVEIDRTELLEAVRHGQVASENNEMIIVIEATELELNTKKETSVFSESV